MSAELASVLFSSAGHPGSRNLCIGRACRRERAGSILLRALDAMVDAMVGHFPVRRHSARFASFRLGLAGVSSKALV
ncbi:hypothetical protein BRPE64_ECDS01380 (plasmid) [Caballeronia insecticola]|uniref:Uncharacterized protein n=1 Tax=Caballeronia insecticola TaxID=758793 RepID=A0A060PRD3_9BURK|nr:hypothetical protein BRPE64_ECDS01380 [Caballeronia insecticola]